jgi:hypothetical protein
MFQALKRLKTAFENGTDKKVNDIQVNLGAVMEDLADYSQLSALEKAALFGSVLPSGELADPEEKRG